MASLVVMQRNAIKEAARLGIQQPLTIQWAGLSTCRLGRRNIIAHAHTNKCDPHYGTICVRRGLSDWRDTIKHEVAHFVNGGGNHHGKAFLVARAKQGAEPAKNYLRRVGALRCSRHVWSVTSSAESRIQKVTSAGLQITATYKALCTRCGKRIG